VRGPASSNPYPLVSFAMRVRPGFWATGLVFALWGLAGSGCGGGLDSAHPLCAVHPLVLSSPLCLSLGTLSSYATIAGYHGGEYCPHDILRSKQKGGRGAPLLRAAKIN
jgi:hypothetical protein